MKPAATARPTSPRRNTLTARIIIPAQISAPERALWDDLCRNDRSLRSAFYSHTYTREVAEVRPYVRVAIIERAGAPIGFLPFQYSGFFARLLRAAEPVGGGMSDYFGLIATPDAKLHSTALLERAGLSSLLFTHLDETQLGHGLTGKQPEPGHRINLDAGAKNYWNALRKSDKRLISDTERRLRKLTDDLGSLRFQFSAADPKAALEFLIERKRRQYARTGVADSLATPWRRGLLYRLASLDDELCRGVVSTLYAGERWVASHFGLVCRDILHYWFPVYNEELKAYAPGRLLLKSIIDATGDAGITEIDRGAGDDPAKRDFANRSHFYYRGLWSLRDARAIASHATLSMKWRIASFGERRPR
jgi:CelD/BcsL family acetyltransferase involved in cellulose biosynthesis